VTQDKVTGGRKLRHEKIHNLYSSSDVNRATKSRRTRLAGSVARVGKMRIAYKIVFQNMKERDHFGGLDMIILKWVLNKWDMTLCTGFICLSIGSSGEDLAKTAMNQRVP
jgi:hypothetical protein